MLNYKKIEAEMVRQKISKSKLCAETKIARTTLDAILNGGDARVSTIEAIVGVLGLPIGYFFDEGNGGVRTAGRDYVEKGRIIHNGAEASAHDTEGIEKLRKENEDLRRRLIDAQAKIIRLMERQ